MFEGSIVALVTPMTNAGALDLPAFDSLIEWHLDNGTDGFVVLGTTGESPTITAEERLILIQRAIAVVNKRKPVIIGTGTNSTTSTITLTQQALDCGADGVLLVNPYYNKPTQAGLFAHFSRVAEAVPIPQILYNHPGRTGCDLLPETLFRLSAYSNIVGMKEATGDIARVAALREAGVTMPLFSGCDDTACAFMAAGGDGGVISVAANVVPKAFADWVHTALSGDIAAATALDHVLQPLYAALALETNPIPVKYAMMRLGKMAAGIRLPLLPLSEEYRSTLDDVLDTLHLSEKTV